MCDATGEWHALVVGVDCYPAFPNRHLAGCANDAEAICRFLIDTVQITEGRVRRLLSPRQDSDASTRATSANIRGAFAAVIGDAVAGDHVVLYFAGHGIRLARQAGGGAADRYYRVGPRNRAPPAARVADPLLRPELS